MSTDPTPTSRTKENAIMGNPSHPDTRRVLEDVTVERARQASKGWTREHDDHHATHDLVTLAEHRLRTPGRPPAEEGYYDRQRLVEGIAMLVAAVEAMDRRGDDD